MSKRNLLTAALALFGALGMVLSAAPSAQADYSTSTSHYWTTKVTTVKITENGDVVRVCDNTNTILKDSSVYLWYYSTSQSRWVPKYGDTLYRYSKGQCKTFRASDGSNFNLPENRKIKVRLNTSTHNYAYHTFYNDH